jgi:hypothetical protein
VNGTNAFARSGLIAGATNVGLLSAMTAPSAAYAEVMPVDVTPCHWYDSVWIVSTPGGTG